VVPIAAAGPMFVVVSPFSSVEREKITLPFDCGVSGG
jgi:hypothetical protein